MTTTQPDTDILRILKTVNHTNGDRIKPEAQEEEVAEDDDGIVARPINGSEYFRVIYDIIHSPSYQVPVLYVTLRLNGATPGGPQSLEKVYELLTPEPLQSPLHQAGVMGGLSMADHPATGTSAYFVHPCRTAEAMAAIVGHEGASPQRYLLVWMGMIGQSVGLNVPIALAEAMGTMK